MKYIDSANLGFDLMGEDSILFTAFGRSRTPEKEVCKDLGEIYNYRLTIAEAKELHELLGELLEEIEPTKQKQTKI